MGHQPCWPMLQNSFTLRVKHWWEAQTFHWLLTLNPVMFLGKDIQRAKLVIILKEKLVHWLVRQLPVIHEMRSDRWANRRVLAKINKNMFDMFDVWTDKTNMKINLKWRKYNNIILFEMVIASQLIRLLTHWLCPTSFSGSQWHKSWRDR